MNRAHFRQNARADRIDPQILPIMPPVARKPKANLLMTSLGVLLTASSLFGIYLGTLFAGTLVWPMLLFEPVVLGCGLVAIAVGLHIQRSSVPMALATTAGCLAVAAFLSTVAGRNTLGGSMLMPLLGLRLVVAATLSLWAAWFVLGPDRAAWQRVLLGCGLLAAGAGLSSLAFIGQAKPVRDWLLSLGGFVASAAALVGFIVFVILVAAGIHLVVRPFEAALDANRPRPRPAA